MNNIKNLKIELYKSPYDSNVKVLKSILESSQKRLIELKNGYPELLTKQQELYKQKENLKKSFSWRITKPLRIIKYIKKTLPRIKTFMKNNIKKLKKFFKNLSEFFIKKILR
jgi:hypothetical protein